MASVTAAQRVRPFIGRETELRALSDLLRAATSRGSPACTGSPASASRAWCARSSSVLGARTRPCCCSTAGRSSRPSAGSSPPRAGSATSRRSSVISGGARRRSCSRSTTTRCSASWTPGCGRCSRRRCRRAPASCSPVASGPLGAWFALERFRTLPLGPLEDADALSVLEHHGIRAGDAARLNRIARGHPLALMLASAGVSEHPELEIEDAAMTRVVEELTRRYLEDVDDPVARRALEAASLVRRVTAPLLAAMTEGGRRRGAAAPARAAVRRRRPRRPHRPRVGPGRRRRLPARHQPDALPPRPPRRVARAARRDPRSRARRSCGATRPTCST